jgi:glycosyl transferase family 25
MEWRKSGKNANARVKMTSMRTYLINLARRPDRLVAMERQASQLGLALDRVDAVDARITEPGTIEGWFAAGGPLGEVPQGDKACLLSHRQAWERFLATSDAHAAFLEDDVRLSLEARVMLAGDDWVPADVAVVKLEHYGPAGQRVLLRDLRKLEDGFQLGRMLSRHTGAATYILSRRAAELLLQEKRFDLPVDHLLFNPNNSKLFSRLSPWQLVPAIARQQDFVGSKSDIETTRVGLRALSLTYARRELVRFGYDLKLLPRQVVALLRGAKFVAVKGAG